MKKVRKAPLVIIIILSLIIITLAFLPTIFSNIGRKFVVNAIEKQINGKASIQNISLSWFGPQKIEKLKLSSPEIELSFDDFSANVPIWSMFHLKSLSKKTLFSMNSDSKLTNASISLHYTGYHPVIFSDINMELQTDNKKAIISISGKTFEKSDHGYFKCNVNLDEDMGLTGNITCNEIPTAGIDRLLFLFVQTPKDMLVSVIGNKANLSSSFSIKDDTGPISMLLDATNAKLKVKGYVSNKTFTLQEPLRASFFLNKELSQYIFKDVNPLFITGVRSRKPIIAAIDNNGFKASFAPFKLKELKIQRASLDMGVIEAENGDSLSLLIGIMKLNPLLSVDRMNMWFTPVNIKINNGYLYTDRMDILIADSIHVCTWGVVDLIKEYVDMTLGLTASALANSFGITGLPEDYVMQLPMKGTTKKVKIDKGLAATKIAALLALQHAGGKNDIIGNILGAVAPREDQSNVPPPKKPFPWQGRIKAIPKQQRSSDSVKKFLDAFQ